MKTGSKEMPKKKMYWLAPSRIKKVENLAAKRGVNGSKFISKVIDDLK